MMKTHCGGLILLLISLAAAPAAAAPPEPGGAAEPGSAESLRQEVDKLQRDIVEREAGLERFDRREEGVLNALDSTEQALQLNRRKAAQLKSELGALEEKISSTESAVEDLNRRIRAHQGYLSRRLVALYKTAWLGTLHFLASAESMVEALQRQKALERIVAHDQQVQESLSAYQDELGGLHQRLSDYQREKQQCMAEYQVRIQAIGREKAKRETLLARIRSQRETERVAIEQLKESALALEEQIRKLSVQPPAGTRTEALPARAFSDAKGLLILPVKGKIVKLFGPYTLPKVNVQAIHNGITIAADRGEPVRAVHGGRVLFADWVKGYGNVIIIDHGNHYYSVYAHLEEFFRDVNQTVEPGDVIATVGDSGAMGTAGLYFELRHHGRPINPLEWCKLP
jgi:septal ring factor EnvC (AmiA/AmiB activator)